jgi:flagella basal body P-ring formation protein FlgA
MIALVSLRRCPRRLGVSLARGALGFCGLLLLTGQPALGLQISQEDSLPPWEPPVEATSRVKEMVAAKWDVQADELLLVWTQPRLKGDAPVLGTPELLGSGRNGRWIVSFALPDRPGENLSVQLRTGVNRLQAFSKTPIARGESLGSWNMEFSPQVHWGSPLDLPPVPEEGWVAQRRIQRGELLTTPGVRAPQLVVSGRPVQLIWTSGKLKISLQGDAVGSAALGERVYVRTPEGHRMAGIVTGPATVLLSDPGIGGMK